MNKVKGKKLLFILATVMICNIPAVVNAMEYSYDENEDIYYLSGIMMDEAGYCDEKQMMYVGSVVLNRVADERFPDSIKDVVLAQGQYQTMQDGKFNLEPTEKVRRQAAKLLKIGSVLPPEVVYQSNFKQGEVYKIYDGVYYCKG